MANKVSVPIAVGGAVAAVVVVLGGIFLFAGGPGDQAGRQAGPAPTTRLPMAGPDPSGTRPTGSPYPRVPDEQVDGSLVPPARTAGRTLYIPVRDGECVREEAWPRGEHADRVEVEIRFLPVPIPSDATTGPDGTVEFGCFGYGEEDVPYAVIELTEPLGDRRIVVKRVNSPVPR